MYSKNYYQNHIEGHNHKKSSEINRKIILYLNFKHPKIQYILQNFKYGEVDVYCKKDTKKLYLRFSNYDFSIHDIGDDIAFYYWTSIRPPFSINISEILKYGTDEMLIFIYKVLSRKYHEEYTSDTMKFKISKVFEKIPANIRLLGEID